MRVEIRQVAACDPLLGHFRGHDIINASEQIWVGLIDDRRIAMWGLIPRSLLSDEAHIWCWVEMAVVWHKVIFIRLSRQVIAHALESYPRLVGICTGNRRWLAWLGAEFGPPVEGYPSFTIKADHG